MIDFELFSTIRNYHEQKGLSANQIADELGLDPRTVSKWLQEKRFRERETVMRPSKLDPFKGAIVRMLNPINTAPLRSCKKSARKGSRADIPSSKITCTRSVRNAARHF